MSESTDRLRRYIGDDAGACCVDDAEERLAELRAHVGSVDRQVSRLGTVADGTRYGIVALLVGADEELCVCEIAPLFDVSDSAVSHALSDLREAGFVTRRKDGKWRYYAATPDAERLLTALGEREH